MLRDHVALAALDQGGRHVERALLVRLGRRVCDPDIAHVHPHVAVMHQLLSKRKERRTTLALRHGAQRVRNARLLREHVRKVVCAVHRADPGHHRGRVVHRAVVDRGHSGGLLADADHGRGQHPRRVCR